MNNASTACKGGWTKEEDETLLRLVTENGAKDWTIISQSLPGRIGKQCRERWHNHLDPNINKKSWTPEEDRLILELHAKLGPKWCEITKHIKGRTDNAVKNRFNSNLKR